MANEKYYTQRIQRLKKRVLDTPPEVDIENAVIVTKAFQETEGQPHYYQKAYSVYKTLLEKSIPIWEDELIVGNSGSKQRSGLVCPDDCWAFLDREIDTINSRTYDPFKLRDEDRKTFLEFIKPGAAGIQGFHKVRTMVRFAVDGGTFKDLEVIELADR